MNNILITGVNGFVGSHLAKRLLNENYNVIGIIRDNNNNKMLKHLEIDNHSKLTLVHGDILERNVIKRCIVDYNIDTIFHLAAQSIVKDALKDPVSTYNINIMGLINILDVCKSNDIKNQILNIIIASTDKVYGEGLNKKENDCINIKELGTYESSKMCEDIVAHSFRHTYNLPITICRPCNIYGFDLNSRVIPNTIKQCINNESPTIFSNVKGVREYIYIDDIINAYVTIAKGQELNSLNSHGSYERDFVFNIGTGEVISQEKLVHKIIDIYTKLTNSFIYPNYIKRDDISHKEIIEQSLDSSLILNKFNWSPSYNLNEGLLQTILKFKELKEIKNN